VTKPTQPNLIVFPGAHKTGTTLLQAALMTNRPLLERHNMCLIEREPFYSSDFSAHLRNKSHGQNNEVSKSVALSSFIQLCNGNVNRTIIISIENLFGEVGHRPRMYHAVKPVLSTFKKFLPMHKMRVAFFVRKQDTFLESIYIQTIQKLKAWNFEEFFEKHRAEDLRWTPILDDIVEFVGAENLSVRPFENIRTGKDAFIQDMFNFISPDLANEIVPTPDRSAGTNISLSKKALDIALTIFPGLDTKERRLLITFLQENFGNDKYPKARLLSATQRSSILSKLYTDNTLLADRYLIGQPGCSVYKKTIG